MPSSTPTTVARYRPAVLVLTGAAAAYAAYLVYCTLQAAPSDGLHRSNAVRRPASNSRLQHRRISHAQPQRRASLTARVISRLDRDVIALGEYTLFGVQVPLNPRNIIPAVELRTLIADMAPDADQSAVEAAVAHLYDVFLDRFLIMNFPPRPLVEFEVEAVTQWVGDRLPDATAVPRAVERHAQAVANTNAAEADRAESVAATELSWASDSDSDGDVADTDGQTLQRTLYHIAEERARHEGVIHRGITCNGCDEKPIRGVRWHCVNCVDFDLCSNCEATNSHIRTHIFYKIRVPASYLSLSKQEPLYPGKPHMMAASVTSSLKKRLTSETKMEAEEVEALWEQFTCLAATEWQDDPNGVGWALDRRAFNHAFVPRYNGFVAAPNLIYDRIFTYYDSDKNGLIGFEEWIKGLDGMHTTDTTVKARIVFNGYDIDGDGYISRRDVLRIFRAYYAIEKEATRNYVAELTEELSAHNTMETIRSSQPLGSAFPPNGLPTTDDHNNRLRWKEEEDASPVILDNDLDVADRDVMLGGDMSSFDVRPRAEQDRAIVDRFVRAERDRIVSARWARRQYYVDEEEGLRRPEGAHGRCSTDSSDEERPESLSDPTTQDAERPRWSRSSSRVHFQDDINADTRSNASTSSRPVGERWGGYEIPEPEKDIGKEVLYQITQQAFNELLNPLFLEKEDNAMDTFETRNERRKRFGHIEQKVKMFQGPAKRQNTVICQVGIFRYSKCVVDTFCNTLNKGDLYGNLKKMFENPNGTQPDREDARKRLHVAYLAVERKILDSVQSPADDWAHDALSLWNAWLCREKLREEVLNSVLECVVRQGWINAPASEQTQSDEESGADEGPTARDPTMPQFRPNSLVDAQFQDGPADDAEDMTAEPEPLDMDEQYLYGDQVVHRRAHPLGPFFALEDVASRHSTTPVSASSEDGEVPSVNIRNYDNTPDIHYFHIETVNDTCELRVARKQVIHGAHLYLSDIDPIRPLVFHIRRLAKDPESPLHDIWLASLEAVEQETDTRKGSGLLSFDEFEGHMRDGRLRFLESWMDWVSL
jgi:Ca2+-binding EF-hand superfamily protein